MAMSVAETDFVGFTSTEERSGFTFKVAWQQLVPSASRRSEEMVATDGHPLVVLCQYCCFREKDTVVR